jgi:hypothetical protein
MKLVEVGNDKWSYANGEAEHVKRKSDRVMVIDT